MSLADSITASLASKATDAVDKKGDEYFDDLMKVGRSEADELPEGSDEAKKALDGLAAIKTPILRLTNVGFATLLGHWQDDDKAEAKRHYMEHEATFVERRALMHAGTDQLASEEDARQAAWDEVEGWLKTVGSLGLQFLGKLLLRTIGIPI